MRLIDADAFKQYCSEGLEEMKSLFKTDKGLELAIKTTESFLKDIDEQPTVEAQPTDEIKEAYLKGYDYGVKDWFKDKTQPTDADCISREAVLSLQTEYAEKMGATTFWKFRDDIRGLPSVTPTNEDIKEAYLKGYEYGVKDWFKTQPCEDAVCREEVQDLISRWLSDYLLDETREALETINYKVGDMPSVIPERPKGKWIDNGTVTTKSCSLCGHGNLWESPYCPNCGSYNGGGEE